MWREDNKNRWKERPVGEDKEEAGRKKSIKI